MLRRLVPWFLVAGCTSGPLGQDGVSTLDEGRDPPWLDVAAPLRGSLVSAETTTVTVRGHVTDDGNWLRVTVNGQVAKIAANGTFEVTAPINAGLTLIRTIATDRLGNQTSDTRAVMGGALVSVTTPVKDGLVARVDARAVRAGGELLAQRLGSNAFGDAMQKRNPLFNESIACIGARADVDSVKHGAVTLSVAPMDEGLYVEADVPDLAFGLQVGWNDSCTTLKSATGTASARHFRMRGMVQIRVGESGLIVADRGATTAELDTFRVAGDKVPAGIASRLQAGLEDTLTDIVADELAARLPSAILSNLGAGRPAEVALALRPTQLLVNSLGVTLVADSTVTLGRGLDAFYLPSAATRPALDAPRDVILGIADDSINQLLASTWTAGGLEESSSEEPTLAGLDALFDTVEIFPRLPPVATALPGGDGLEVVFGDVECHLMKGGKTVARLALSGEMAATVTVQGQTMTLATHSPRVFVDALRDSRSDPHVVPAGAQARVVSFLEDRIVARLAQTLSRVPLPASAAAMSVAPFLGTSANHGYLVVTSDYTPPEQ